MDANAKKVFCCRSKRLSSCQYQNFFFVHLSTTTFGRNLFVKYWTCFVDFNPLNLNAKLHCRNPAPSSYDSKPISDQFWIEIPRLNLLNKSQWIEIKYPGSECYLFAWIIFTVFGLNIFGMFRMIWVWFIFFNSSSHPFLLGRIWQVSNTKSDPVTISKEDKKWD